MPEATVKAPVSHTLTNVRMPTHMQSNQIKANQILHQFGGCSRLSSHPFPSWWQGVQGGKNIKCTQLGWCPMLCSLASSANLLSHPPPPENCKIAYIVSVMVKTTYFYTCASHSIPTLWHVCICVCVLSSSNVFMYCGNPAREQKLVVAVCTGLPIMALSPHKGHASTQL